ncbi:MAG: hypothetical protein LBI89_00550, partial [Prevotellaceae bacterium]|nr:hypothetical protein [Prevotellaceae bacterium]
LSASATYYAQSRNTTTFCVSATRLAVKATIVANPSTPSLSQNGPKCAGTAVTFTASGGSGSYNWNGQFSGSGTAKTSPTTAGSYSAQVRSVTTASGATCYSAYTSSVTGTVNAPAGYGFDIKVGSCGCAAGLVICGPRCAPKCDRILHTPYGCNQYPFTHTWLQREEVTYVWTIEQVAGACMLLSDDFIAVPPGNMCLDFNPHKDGNGVMQYSHACRWWPF